MAKRTKPSTDSDHPWKEIITFFLEDAILLIEPPLHAMIDWSRGFEVLEQELYEIIKTRFRGAKLCDKLIKVWTKAGKPLFQFIHVEIETNPKKGFSLRFYHYRILIFDKHKSENIYSIAIYPGAPSANQVDKYEFKLVRNEITFKFPAFKIWEQNELELMASENIFALLVLAQQYANNSKNDAEQRLSFREKLFDLAMQKNIPRRKILQALIFVRYLMTLPEDLEVKYKTRVRKRVRIKTQSSMFKLEDVIWIDSLLEEVTGESLQQKIAKAEKKVKDIEEKAKLTEERVKRSEEKAKHSEEKAKRIGEKAKQAEENAKQIRQQLERAIRKCYRERNWTVQEIAEFFSIDKSEVELIIKKKR